jgi:hypothetical protein
MEATTDVIFPTIHMNGTSSRELLDQLCKAMLAISKAQEALSNAAPNGRDYYPQGGEALRMALDQHCARVRKLAEVRKELKAIADHIADL